MKPAKVQFLKWDWFDGRAGIVLYIQARRVQE